METAHLIDAARRLYSQVPGNRASFQRAQGFDACVPSASKDFSYTVHPADAISFEHGKDHQLCMDWCYDAKGKLGAPTDACGECQVRVPCETRIP